MVGLDMRESAFEHAHEGLEDSVIDPADAKIQFVRFAFVIAAQLIGYPLLLLWISPRAFHVEVAHPWVVLLWAVGIGLPLSLFEYLYHRYLLHSAVFPFMSAMQRAHVQHHGLTNVKAAVRANEPEKPATVFSEYPIEESHQEESMMFPFFSGPIFVAVFEILMGAPLKLMFPSQPVLLGVMFSVILYYSAYEIWHALLHLPFEHYWKPRLKSPMVRRVYGFHLMHHWRPTSNLAIVGFWGAATWDHLFRTHRRPDNMPLHQAQVTYIDGKLDHPRWPISMLDSWQAGLSKGSRRLERFLGRVFLGRR